MLRAERSRWGSWWLVLSLRQPRGPVVGDLPVRVECHFPRVSVGVDEHSRVAAPEGLGPRTEDRPTGSLGLSENTYLVTSLVLGLVVAAYAVREHLLPAVERWPLASFVSYSLGYAVVIALVFVFLRPIQQFIYLLF